MVLVTVTSTSVPSLNIVVPPAYDSGSGTFHVTFAGIPDYAYTVQTATERPVVVPQNRHRWHGRPDRSQRQPDSAAAQPVLPDGLSVT